MGGVTVYITMLWTFTWLHVGVCGARRIFCNKIHLVQTIEYIQLNFAVVFHTMYYILNKGLLKV